jgi:hypothetical protein
MRGNALGKKLIDLNLNKDERLKNKKINPLVDVMFLYLSFNSWANYVIKGNPKGIFFYNRII